MSYWDESISFETLKGQTITSIDKNDDEIVFTAATGERYRMYHSQDCCESVYVESVVGDLDDLIGNPILVAEEATSNELQGGQTGEGWGSFTWTFYKLATIKGHVDIRWYGSSNGYYSESVDFIKMKEVA